MTAKVPEAKRRVSRFRRDAPIESGEKKYDISPLAVKMKGMFAKGLHALMQFRNKLETTRVSISIDGRAVLAFRNFQVDGGGGSLQKAVIGPTGVTVEVETANMGNGGFIMNSVTIRSSGRVVSTITYADMPNIFPDSGA